MSEFGSKLKVLEPESREDLFLKNFIAFLNESRNCYFWNLAAWRSNRRSLDRANHIDVNHAGTGSLGEPPHP